MVDEESSSKGQRIELSSSRNKSVSSEQALPPAKVQPQFRRIGAKLSVMPCACLLPKIAELGNLITHKSELEFRYHELTQARNEERSREQIAEESMLSQVVSWLKDSGQ